MMQSVAIGMRGIFATAMLLGALSSAKAQEFQLNEADFGRVQYARQADTQDGQEQIAEAQNSRRGINFVVVNNVRVTRLLPDDTKGSRHQKWFFQIANGSEIMGVYNIDLGERIPLNEGDTINLAGQYIWDRSGGVLHWLHADPAGRRHDGYVEVNGVRYGEVDKNGGNDRGRGRGQKRRR